MGYNDLCRQDTTRTGNMIRFLARILAKALVEELGPVIETVIEDGLTRQDERLYKRALRAGPPAVIEPVKTQEPDYPGKPMKRG